MAVLILGLLLFLGTHSIAMLRPSLREQLIERLSLATWQSGYALFSLIGILLVGWGYDLARQTPLVLWTPPGWLSSLNLLLMLPVFTLLFAAYLPGRIQSAVKHPMLVAVKIWAFSHLLVNGALADVLLFGAFLAWAVAELISLRHRAGPPVQGAPAGRLNDAIALIGGLVLYLLFLFWLHGVLFGVEPLG